MRNIFVLGMLFLISHVAAAGLPPKPERCPKINTITFTENDLVEGFSGDWEIKKSGKFNTKDTWFVIIFSRISTTINKHEAFTKLRIFVPTMTYRDGPFPALDEWGCGYDGSESTGALAFNP